MRRPARPARTGRIPAKLIGWGLSAGVGHNQGPPLEAENDLFVRYRWRKAHREVWQNPGYSIMMFRLARARAAGVSYREYMLELLDTGRHLQAEDVARRTKPDVGDGD